MRIKRLEFQAFGPFKDREIIEFDRLGDQGLFLISGPTGAGKTTIFDAIIYALFGGSSTGERTGETLRFANSPIDTETYVELDFVYKNQDYKIRRSPAYERAKVRGSGTMIQEAQLVLDLPTGKQLSNTKADKKIVDILQINRDQYSRIGMLAQGNFSKFLKAPSKEKIDLFRDIFGTGKYKSLEANISSRLNKADSGLSNLASLKDGIISGLQIPDDRLEDYDFQKDRGLSYLIPLLESIIKEAEEKAEKLNDEIIEKTSIREEKIKILDKVNDYQTTKVKLDQDLARFEVVSKEFDELKIKNDNLAKDEEKQRTLYLSRDKLQRDRDKFARLQDFYKTQDQIKGQVEGLKLDLTKEEEDLKALQVEIKDLKKVIETNKNLEVQIKDLESQEIKLSYDLGEFEKIKTLLDSKKDLEANSVDLAKKHLQALDKLGLDQENYNKQYRLFNEAKYGVIAEDLVEGKPCPVCGSTHHPAKAHKPDHIPSQDQLDEALEVLDKSRQVEVEAKSDLRISQERLEANSKELDQSMSKKNLTQKDFDFEYSKIQDQLKRVVNELGQVKEEVEVRLKDQERLDQMEFSKDEKQKQISDLQLEIKGKDQDLVNLENRIVEEVKDLEGKDLITIDQEFKNISDEIKELETYIDETRKTFEKLGQDYYKLENEIATNRLRLDDKYDLNKEDLEDQIDKEGRYLEELREDLNINKNICSVNTKGLNSLENLKEEIQGAEDMIGKLRVLDSVLKGKVAGAKKISFEAFVQTKYLDQILDYSNKRFYDMTDGKYNLRRKTDLGINSKVGLDIEVMDHHNKKLRPIESLSGGESFQASLSLALGLSDMIQSQASGIRLESMFVDEGFGTLDSDTLAKVMSTLLRISSDNKLVGLISHVPTMKDQIDKQIIIEKTNQGYSKISKQLFD